MSAIPKIKNINKIYLVGFMGTGKSSVGRELAKRMKWYFADLDELIELREKRTIQEIFAKEGERYFRKLETQALKDIAKEDKFVVACGGGIVTVGENIKIMKETGRLVCLAASPQVILQRTAGHKHRPLLNVADPQAQIGLLLKMRAPFYAQADKTIDTSRLSVREVVDGIIKFITAKDKKVKRKIPR